MPDHAFSTLHLPPDRRVARWTEAAADRFVESSFKVGNPDGFVASMLNRDMAELSLTRIVSAGHGTKRVTRSHAQAARASEDFFLVSLQLDGACRLGQRGREALLAPGEFAIYDTREPYELELRGDYRQAVLRVPRRSLRARLPACDGLVARTVAADALPARMLTQIVQEACRSDVRPGPAVSADIALGMLGVLTGGLRGLEEDIADAHQRSPLLRVRAHVLAHLGDPALGIATIAQAFGWSASYLHKLFAAEPMTLERWIWSQRVEACESALVDPLRRADSITRIAFEFGFSDAAHFSRRFQQRFGRSPREHRAAAAGSVRTSCARPPTR